MNEIYCEVGKRECRHASICYKVIRKQVFDRYGFPVKRDYHDVYETHMVDENIKYCNDAGDYISNVEYCPVDNSLGNKQHVCNSNENKTIKDTLKRKQLTQTQVTDWVVK